MRAQENMSKNGQDRHWASINEVSFVAGMRFLFWICRVFGRWPFRIVLYPVLLWYVTTKPVARRASQAYLHRIDQHLAQHLEIKTKVKTSLLGVMKHYASFAEAILDKMLLWGGLFKTTNVKFYGVEQIDQRVLEKKGALIVCSHLGNLELSRVLSRRRTNARMTVLVHTKHAQAFNQMLGKLDPNSQLNLMQVTEITPATAMSLAEKIAQGEFVVIAGDRVPVADNPRVAMANFLGMPAAFPVGPYILASILQCPIYMLFSLQNGEHPEVHFELLRESVRVPRKGRDEALAALVADYAARLEYHCLRTPLQWFNFYDFWHLPQLDNPDAPR